jgi:glycosyltransferase involved in cell wall biosynthesis
MKIVGITRIRNEENVIGHTLNHLKGFCDTILVYDDCSTDNTVELCKKSSIVSEVIENKNWEKDPKKRLELEGTQRDEIYRKCLKYNPDWVYYFDADEFIEFDKNSLFGITANAIRCQFFDFYITDEDVDKHFLERKYCGLEYREIITLFKPEMGLNFPHREPFVPNKNELIFGKVKHYGKAISVDEWEKTCDYYSNYLYEINDGILISDKWEKRKGKAIHKISDFGTKLITWEDTLKLNLIKKI